MRLVRMWALMPIVRAGSSLVQHANSQETGRDERGRPDALRCQQLLRTGEGSCREVRQVLRWQEDLATHAREMDEREHAKDQLRTLLTATRTNLGM
jgi:hypothetical protein